MGNGTKEFFEHMMAHLIPRLEREGKMDNARALQRTRYEFYMAQRGCKKETAKRSAWRDVCAEFPPDKQAEREESIRKKEASKKKTRESVRMAIIDNEEREKEKLAEIAQAIGKVHPEDDSRLPSPIAFALNNMHLIVDPDRPGKWFIKPNDAPDPASWNMLMMAARNRSAFMQIVTKELIAIQKDDERLARQEAREQEERERQQEEEKRKRGSDLNEEPGFIELNRILENAGARPEKTQQAEPDRNEAGT